MNNKSSRLFPIDKVYVWRYHSGMNTIRVSATAARNNFFELLNAVALGKSVIVERDHKEVAVIAPKKQTVNWVALKKASKAVASPSLASRGWKHSTR